MPFYSDFEDMFLEDDLEQILREEGMSGELSEAAKDLLWPWRNVHYEDNY